MAHNLPTGFERLRGHFPGLRSPRGIALHIAAVLLVFGLTSGFFVLVDRYFAEWLPDGQIVILALGFLVFSRFFSQKERYLARFGERAYARAFTAFGIPGLGIVFACVAHLGYMPGPMLPNLWWKPIVVGVGWLILVIGVLLWWRAINALGIDYLTMLYVYFPAERRIVDSGIYQLVRHPIYAAAIHIGTGLALIHAGWYSILSALIFQVFFFGWIRLVEERELIRQLPDYLEYRRRVPPFGPRLGDVPRFYRLLVLGVV